MVIILKYDDECIVHILCHALKYLVIEGILSGRMSHIKYLEFYVILK